MSIVGYQKILGQKRSPVQCPADSDSLDVQLFLDGDTQMADAQRLWGTITPRGPQVEVGPHFPKVGMEGVQVAVALRVIEGQLTLLTLQFYT